MRLLLKRSQVTQNKRASFQIHCTIELTDHEKEMVRRYGLRSFSGVWSDDSANDAYVKNALQPDGTLWSARDVFSVMAMEKRLRDACAEMQAYWEVAQSYGGDETVEFDAD